MRSAPRYSCRGINHRMLSVKAICDSPYGHERTGVVAESPALRGHELILSPDRLTSREGWRRTQKVSFTETKRAVAAGLALAGLTVALPKSATTSTQLPPEAPWTHRATGQTSQSRFPFVLSESVFRSVEERVPSGRPSTTLAPGAALRSAPPARLQLGFKEEPAQAAGFLAPNTVNEGFFSDPLPPLAGPFLPAPPPAFQPPTLGPAAPTGLRVVPG